MTQYDEEREAWEQTFLTPKGNKRRTPNYFNPNIDPSRFRGQQSELYSVMEYAYIENQWLTLDEIRDALETKFGGHAQQASISANLRALRKLGAIVNKRIRIGNLFEYQVKLEDAE